MPIRCDRRRWEGQMRQITKFLRAKVATDWLCDPSHVTAICPARASGPRVDDMILRGGTI